MNTIHVGIDPCRKLNIDLKHFNSKKMYVKYIKNLNLDIIEV